MITLDGLRWQEMFTGADQRLMTKDSGVREPEVLKSKFWAEDAKTRRQRLMPFFWDVVARRGQVFGDPNHDSKVTVTNGRYFSYPGYSEICCGFGDESIDSNDKKPNKNVSVFEWLIRKDEFRDRVSVFASWDVFPFILNSQRSGIYVNAGWQPLDVLPTRAQQRQINSIAAQLPHYWSSVRFDTLTFHGAIAYLQLKKPRVLYVALGETDDWAHDGRYDLYLGAAWQNDDFIKQLWDEVQSNSSYAGKTSFVITTDHGRGDGREGWKSHGAQYAGSDRIWAAVIGPDTPALGMRKNVQATQGQIAASVAALLGLDFTATDPRIAAPLPGIIQPDAN